MSLKRFKYVNGLFFLWDCDCNSEISVPLLWIPKAVFPRDIRGKKNIGSDAFFVVAMSQGIQSKYEERSEREKNI